MILEWKIENKWNEKNMYKKSNVSPERFWHVVVSHGGIILLWQKLSLDEIHNGMKPYLMETSYVFASVIYYCNSAFLNSCKNLMKSPSWFNVYLKVRYIKPKAGFAHCRFSQKRTNEFDFFAVKSKKANKKKYLFVFWENLWRANLLSVLSDLL